MYQGRKWYILRLMAYKLDQIASIQFRLIFIASYFYKNAIYHTLIIPAEPN